VLYTSVRTFWILLVLHLFTEYLEALVMSEAAVSIIIYKEFQDSSQRRAALYDYYDTIYRMA
jgi:hypothetical protein